MLSDTCCFTGHRVIPKEKYMIIKTRLEQEIERLAEEGVTNFCAGGALGFDTMAALTVLGMKKRMPEIKLFLILPCEEQAEDWSALNQAIYTDILLRADEIVYVEEKYVKGCMQRRNRELVDRSEYCICYLEKLAGGTAYTVNYAKSLNRKIINVIE